MLTQKTKGIRTRGPAKGKTARALDTVKNPLVGHFFHSLNPKTGKVDLQGTVIGNPESGWYLVQMFEWLFGQPSYQRLFKIEDMSTWLFYEDAEEMKFSYEEGTARPGGPYQDRV